MGPYTTPHDRSRRVSRPSPWPTGSSPASKKGSRHRHQAHQYLARVHRRVAHIRQAFHWDLAHNLCRQYDIIRLETLNLAGHESPGRVPGVGPGLCQLSSTSLHHVAAKNGGRWCSMWAAGFRVPNCVPRVDTSTSISRSVIGSATVKPAASRIGGTATPPSISSRKGRLPCGGHPVSLASASVDG